MKYSYKTLENNAIKKGHIQASSIDEVTRFLRSKNLLIIDIYEQNDKVYEFIQSVLYRISFNDVVNFTRQLAIMLNAGLTLINSLDILKKQITNKPALLKMIKQIDDDIRSGINFSSALKKQSQHFGSLYIALVKAGEASGKLDDILLRLADNLEKKRILIGKIKGALIYPAILIVGMLAVMIVMITFVVPKLIEIYANFEAGELPAATKTLIFISNIFVHFWPLLIIGLAGIILGVRAITRTKGGKTIVDRFILKLPVIGKIISISSLVDVTRTFSILIGSGVSILDAITIVKETSGNSVYQSAFSHVYKKVEKGESLGTALEREGVFPPILVQMAKVGEESGHLDETMMRISRYFEIQSEEAIKAMTTLIEPVILLILGVGVG
ncbi:MAG TPA: type II secretion system F family protein, partial [Patescibacteria group bacterium]|nr:type II secretion system F family protein [Patescibacteria group bacterium]